MEKINPQSTPTNWLLLGTACLALVLGSCSAKKNGEAPRGSIQNLVSDDVRSASLTLHRDAALVYDSKTGFSSALTMGNYVVTISVDDEDSSSAPVNLIMKKKLSSAPPPPVVTPIQIGVATTISIPENGNYEFSIAHPADDYQVPDTFSASVGCSGAFDTSLLRAGEIKVRSTAAENNVFQFSAADVVPNNSYRCTWDKTGSGIVSTEKLECDQWTPAQYVNYVGSRNIAVNIEDSCGQVHRVPKTLELAHTPVDYPGKVFITGHLDNDAAGDPRVDEVHYMATNQTNFYPVLPKYSSGSFTIKSTVDYGLANSPITVEIRIKGITGSFNARTGVHNLSANEAYIDSLTYLTDRAGDTSPELSLTAPRSSCTWGNKNFVVVAKTGTPCTDGSGATNNEMTIEVWGDITCTGLSGSGKTNMTFTGKFDGADAYKDACVGGGGGGGGLNPWNG